MIDLNFKAQLRAPGPFDGGGNGKQIIVTRATLEFKARLDERQENALCFQGGVREAELAAHQFRSTALEPFEGAGIVERAHLVGLAVANSQLNDIGEFAHGKSIAEDSGDINRNREAHLILPPVRQV